MQNIKTTIDLPKIKPIKKKLDEVVHTSNVEVYYGNAPLAIPFKWESQPGTPKVKILETPLPPLTPPPSYLEKKMKNAIQKQTKGKLLRRLFFLPKLNLRKSHLQSSPTSSSSSSSCVPIKCYFNSLVGSQLTRLSP
ncbi:hypothetical protein P3L10_019548 [Capsicum annuum]